MHPHSEIRRLPTFEARMKALDDFDDAMSALDAARRELRLRMPSWRWIHRYELRRARRYWHRYAKTIKSIREPKNG